MSATPDEWVAQADVAAYLGDGAVVLRGVFDRYWLSIVAAGIEANLANPSPYSESLRGEQGAGRFFNDYCNWQRIPEFRAYIHDSPAAPIVAKLMGSRRAIFYHEHVLVKEPGALKPTPWHHDQPYYPVDGQQICSIWMPLDPVPEPASLRFVKGSHAWGKLFMPRKFATARDYGVSSEAAGVPEFDSVPDIDGHPERYEILAWALAPGDCVVFHGAALHSATGNVSLANSRRVLSTRWVGDEARFVERPWQISPPVTGGLKPGDALACDTFPAVWPRD